MRARHKILRESHRAAGPTPTRESQSDSMNSNEKSRVYAPIPYDIDDNLSSRVWMSPAHIREDICRSNICSSTSNCDNLYNPEPDMTGNNTSTTALGENPSKPRVNCTRRCKSVWCSLQSFIIVYLLATVIQAHETTDLKIRSQVARDFAKRATPTMIPLTVKSNHNDLNELPPMLANYVKLQRPNNSSAPYRSASASNSRLLASNNQTTRDINQLTIRRLPDKICIGTSNRLSGQINKTDHYQNLVERYRNCTHVIGNLEITWLQRGPDNEPLDLSFLESIKEITGYLLIAYVQAEKIKLPNLLIIRGREVFRLNMGRKEEFSMFVISNDLKYIEMPNLREIITGHVGFYYNKNLCLVDTIDWGEILNTDLDRKSVV